MDNQSVFCQENNMDRKYKIMEGTRSDDGLLNCGIQQATEEKMRIFWRTKDAYDMTTLKLWDI